MDDLNQAELDVMGEQEAQELSDKIDVARTLIRLRDTDDWKLINKLWDDGFMEGAVTNYSRLKPDRRFITEEGILARSLKRRFYDDIIEDGNMALARQHEIATEAREQAEWEAQQPTDVED